MSSVAQPLREVAENDEVREDLQELVDEQGWELETLADRFQEEVAETMENALGDPGRAKVEEWTVKRLRSAQQASNRVVGEFMEIPMLSLGHTGIQQWNDSDRGGEKDVLLAYAVINPEDERAGLASIVIDETAGPLDPHEARDQFEPMALLRGHFALSPVEELTTEQNAYYELESTPDSRVDRPDPDELGPDDPLAELPASREAKLELLRENFLPRVKLARIFEQLSATDGQGRTMAWGVDLKRFEGQVVDCYRNFEGDWSQIVLMDDSMLQEDIEGTALENDRDGSTPGLTAFMPPEFHDFGVDSRVVIWGSVTKDSETGEITMNAAGAEPLVKYPYEDDDGGSSGGGSSDREVESI